jgi:hypothetical protein
MDLPNLIILVAYVAGYFFSFGMMKNIFDLNWNDYCDPIPLVGLLFIMIVWPIWWVCYIPYKVGTWLAK